MQIARVTFISLPNTTTGLAASTKGVDLRISHYIQGIIFATNNFQEEIQKLSGRDPKKIYPPHWVSCPNKGGGFGHFLIISKA